MFNWDLCLTTKSNKINDNRLSESNINNFEFSRLPSMVDRGTFPFPFKRSDTFDDYSSDETTEIALELRSAFIDPEIYYPKKKSLKKSLFKKNTKEDFKETEEEK